MGSDTKNRMGSNMPRSSRQRSSSGYFHVIVRGVGKQILFEETSDYRFFLLLLEKKSLETSIKVCAYCLMENHVHLLLYDSCQNLSLFMKKIGICYAGYFNHKYERIGHVFQDRYKSEAIENNTYFLNALRYILKNPEKAGICRAEDYLWSSYDCYDSRNSFIDNTLLTDLIKSRGEYEAFIRGESHEDYMEFEPVRKTDEEAKELIHQMGIISGTGIGSLGKGTRNEIISRLKKEGLSIRQIERLTGIGRGVIQRVK